MEGPDYHSNQGAYIVDKLGGQTANVNFHRKRRCNSPRSHRDGNDPPEPDPHPAANELRHREGPA